MSTASSTWDSAAFATTIWENAQSNGAKGGDLSNNLNKSNTSIQHKIENIQNLFNKEKQNIENNFKKEKEYYLKDQANKVESISQLKEINRKLDQDNESARKTIDDLTAKLKDYKKNLDLTQEIRNHFDEELEKKISKTDVKNVLKLGDKCITKYENLLEEIGKGKDDEIIFEEFCKLLAKIISDNMTK